MMNKIFSFIFTTSVFLTIMSYYDVGDSGSFNSVNSGRFFKKSLFFFSKLSFFQYHDIESIRFFQFFTLFKNDLIFKYNFKVYYG